MTKHLISLAAMLALASPSIAQEEPQSEPSPGEIVAEANAAEWIAIDPEDLLVMTLAPDAEGNERKVVIQLMPAPFSEAWTANIRTFTRAGWYDDISVNRVQDNYVVQWGDVNYDNPESDGPPKELPDGLLETSEADYSLDIGVMEVRGKSADKIHPYTKSGERWGTFPPSFGDPYSMMIALKDGWPLGLELSGTSEFEATAWPVHCYGMVGVGRNYSPDAGTGAELYTVIGHAPRHLDRNIALVGRIVEGIEHLSSLPRGKGQLGFYEDASKRTPILTVRVASDLASADQPRFEYLDTEGETFARYADSRANRRDPFFNVAAGGADICNIPVPVRRVAE